jgi:hypothetical protein
MRKVLVAATAALMLFTVLPAGGSEPPGREEQWFQGFIRLPTRFTDGEGGWPGLARRVWLCSAATNGSIGYIADIWPESWNGMFVIDGVSDRTGEANVNVYFYSEFGDCGGQAAPTSNGEFATAGPGGEVGFVPEGATKAVIFTANGVDTSFTYTSWAVPLIRIGQDNLDLRVVAGALVEWRNNTSDYSYVTSTTGAFDSSPGQGTGIPVGQTWSHRFNQPGEFAYETSAGEGTITVVPTLDDL